MLWVIYIVAVLAVSGAVGMHLGRFREAYTEMMGMMAGMTMGMINGFVLGYAAAAAVGISATASGSMLWGNLFGIVLGLALGVYFGRPGGLIGIMDGAMGGVMGGSMGAMLSVMVRFPEWALVWTSVLLTVIWIASMVTLVVLIERSASGHAALHRLAPFFTRAIFIEAAEAADNAERAGRAPRRASAQARSRSGSRWDVSRPLPEQTTALAVPVTPTRRLVDYYALLGVPKNADADLVLEAYLEKQESAGDDQAGRLERAFEILTDPQRREAYDRKLAESLNWAGYAASAAAVAPATNGFQLQRGREQSAGTLPVRPAGSGKGDLRSNGAANGRLAVAGPGYGSRSGTGSGRAAHDYANAGRQSTSKGQRQVTAAGRGQQGRQRESQALMSRREQARYPYPYPYPHETRRRVSWAGWAAVAVVVVIVGWWLLSSFGIGVQTGAGVTQGGRAAAGSGGSGGSGGQAASLEEQAVTVPVGSDGRQTLNVVLDGARFQYKPSVIKVKQGIPVRFNLSIENGDPG